MPPEHEAARSNRAGRTQVFRPVFLDKGNRLFLLVLTYSCCSGGRKKNYICK
jgi:hypothetical protein